MCVCVCVCVGGGEGGVGDKWTILGPKMAHPHNSGSVGRIFFRFCTLKKAKPIGT